MKLDPRILYDKQPLTIFNTDIAKTFIGCKGFFANDLARMRNLDTVSFGTLIGVKEEGKYSLSPFASNVPNFRYYQFFLPEDWVKAEIPKKKYRPLTDKEFLELFDLGKLYSIRAQGKERVVITGIYLDEAHNLFVNLCGNDIGYSPKYFFNLKFEYFDGEWKPFAVKENE